jgi:Holliday junction resolvasome RuvABC endonuclease subunit
VRRRSEGRVRTLSFDPGFADLGWSFSERFARHRVTPVALGLVKTEKEEGARASADTSRRVEELAVAIRLLREEWRPEEIATEAFSPVRSASVTAKMAMSWCVIRCEALYAGIPFREVSPMAMKLAVTGKRTASKGEVQAALAARFGGELLDRLLRDSGVKRCDYEHPMDALGVSVAIFGATLGA